ncbi:MAG: phenylalanine--tRNA ligase subunit alpha [Oligoflexales bacterium]|nr:phenylalanine--tRNA ligase subunit alpha [Oligoflexales bacterium]
MTFINTIESLTLEFQEDMGQVRLSFQVQEIEALRIKWMGRKGRLAHLFESLKNLSREEKPEAGKKIHSFEQQISAEISKIVEEGKEARIQAKLSSRPLDISLPVNPPSSQGSLHPITLMQEKLRAVFKGMGFAMFDGPELELELYNFTLLNIPDDHPARDMQDSFFLKNGSAQNQIPLLLRTHTSNSQIHAMLQNQPPLRVISMGRCYRVDNDATHSPMFHQIEGFVVDEGISMAHLKGTLDRFVKDLLGRDQKTRFRPSYFPFVEPGAEMDVQCTLCHGKAQGCRVCKETGWIELGGCGMIHPKVFKNLNFDHEKYSGFAFGFGIDRMAMMLYGLSDLRLLFEGDLRFQAQFPVHAS